MACGVQGPPHPPRLEYPTRITDLAVVEVGRSLELRFRVPTEATDGNRLTKPLEIKILRALALRGGGLSKLPEPEVCAQLAPEEWERYAHQGVVSYLLPLTESEFGAWRGQTLVLSVRTLTRGFRHRALESEPSNLVDVPVVDVSEPVSGVTINATEKALEIRFAAPTRMLGGGELKDLVAYRVYRSTGGARGSFQMIGQTSGLLYRDSQFEFGHVYAYQVRAVFGDAAHPALSEDSQPVQITPRDVFAPAPPQGLTGLFSAGGVELVWTANPEPDLAGYNVYCLDAQPPRRLNKELLRTPIFRDTSPAQGATLGFYVTAVDRTGNESKPSEKVDVETK